MLSVVSKPKEFFKHNNPPAESGLINQTLPIEVLEKVFSYLENKADMKHARLVCKGWNYVVINLRKSQICSLAKARIKSLIGAEKGANLINTISFSKILSSESFESLKQSLNTLKKDIVKELIQWPQQTKLHESLDIKCKSATEIQVFQDIPDLVKMNFYTMKFEILETDRIKDGNSSCISLNQNDALVHAAIAASELGKINYALKLGNSITEDYQKMLFCCGFSKKIANIKKNDGIINIACTITSDTLKQSSLFFICGKMIDYEITKGEGANFNKVIEIAELITKADRKNSILNRIDKNSRESRIPHPPSHSQ